MHRRSQIPIQREQYYALQFKRTYPYLDYKSWGRSVGNLRYPLLPPLIVKEIRYPKDGLCLFFIGIEFSRHVGCFLLEIYCSGTYFLRLRLLGRRYTSIWCKWLPVFWSKSSMDAIQSKSEMEEEIKAEKLHKKGWIPKH